MADLSDDKIDQLLRSYGSALRAEADQRFAGRRARMIRRAVDCADESALQRLRRRFSAILDNMGLSAQFAGGAAVAVCAMLLAVAYLPSLRPSQTVLQPVAESRGSQTVFSEDEIASADLGPASGADSAGSSEDDALAMNDLRGAFDQPLGPAAEEAALWPDDPDSELGGLGGLSGMQYLPADTKDSEDDEIEELTFDEDEFA